MNGARAAAHLASWVLGTVLAGCAVPGGMPQADAAACDEAAGRFAVGRPYSAALLEEVRHRSGARRVRVVRPDDRLTMEFDPVRLNVELDAGGQVVRLRCG